MKNGKCPMCNSTEVYMTENYDNLTARGDELHFRAETAQDTVLYRFDTYVCTDCGFTAMFAKSDKGLGFLKQADDWQKAG